MVSSKKEKVLIVTWTWYPIGGDWTYIENVKRLYEENGYEVIPFSTISENNVKSEYEKYFVKSANYKELNKKKSIANGLKAARNSVVSSDALKKISLLLKEHQIAFAHFHIIQHYVTPAIIWKLKKAGVPIIWTLHEYKLICPENTFVSNGKICEKCHNHKFYNCAINKCKKQSFWASALASLDGYFYYFSGLYKKIDFFLCPSQFLLNKYQQFNFPESKLTLTNYCYDIASLDSSIRELEERPASGAGQGKYFLYVGRIEKVKGIFTMINAICGTDIVLKIAGTGSLLEEITEYVANNNLSNIEILGLQNKKEVYALTLNALCVICPSEWYENYPFSVIESMLFSKAVIGASIGGIPELVIDNKTGLLFTPGDHVELRKKLSILWNDPELAMKLGNAGREYACEKVNFNAHWLILKNIINQLQHQ